MSQTLDDAFDQIEALAKAKFAEIEEHLDEELRPKAAEILVDSTLVAARAASGQDVTTKRIALESRLRNLPRNSKALVQLKAREVALQAVFSFIHAALGA